MWCDWFTSPKSYKDRSSKIPRLYAVTTTHTRIDKTPHGTSQPLSFASSQENAPTVGFFSRSPASRLPGGICKKKKKKEIKPDSLTANPLKEPAGVS